MKKKDGTFVRAKLRDLVIENLGLVDAGANQGADVVIAKRATIKVEDDMTDAEKQIADAVKAAEAKSAKELADAQTALKKAEAELQDLKGSGELSTDLETLRKRNADAEKAYAAERTELQKQLDARTAEVEKARAEVVKIRQQRRREEFIKRAGELTGLPGAAADDFGELLDQINAGLFAVIPDKPKAEKAFEKLNRLLTSWNAVVKQSAILQEVGRVGAGQFRGAEAQLDHLAKEMAAGSGGKLTYFQAYAKVMEQNPGLYKQHLAEKES